MRKLFLSLRNLLPQLPAILTIIATFLLGVVSIWEFKPVYLLIPLGLLGIDAVVERHIYLRKILETVKPSKQPLVENRDQAHQRAKMAELLERHQSVLLLGITLVSTVPEYHADLIRAARSGKQIRLLLLPEDLPQDKLDWVAPVYDASGEQLASDLKSTYSHLRQIAKTLAPEHRRFFTVKNLRTFNAFSAVVCDPKLNAGTIMHETHLYKSSTSDRLCTLMTHSDDPLYSRHLKSIQDLWDDAADCQL